MFRFQSIVLALLATLLPTAARGGEYLSPTALAAVGDERILLVAQYTGRRIDWFDTSAGKIVRSIALGDGPRGLTCSADGNTAYVVSGEGEGTLHALDVASGKMLWQAPVGHGPMAPVRSPDGKTLYICNRFDNAIGIVDLEQKKQVKTIPVVREPVGAALTPDGKFLFVANHLPDGPATADYVAARISVIDTAKRELVKDIGLVNGSEGLRGICASPDGKYIYATHLLARFQIPTTQLDHGWICTAALSIIRVSDFKLLYTVLLDDVDRGFANPWGVVVSHDNKLLCVGSAGNNEVSLIDLPALAAKVDAALNTLGTNADVVDLNTHNDLSMLADVRKRVPLKGVGARAMLEQHGQIYIAEYFSDSLGRVTLQDGQVKAVDSIPLGPQLPLTPERKGEILFNDARICFQNWLSCASCHPDARMDGLNWDLLNDGIGNPKNAKSMLLAHQTPPATWLGVRPDAETSVRSGFRHIEFVVRSEEDSIAVDAYLCSLKQTPSPYLVEGKLSEAAQRGRKIFTTTGCAHCHPAPLYTDLKQYNVGTGTRLDANRSFDVPSLREAWRTAPYLHDGRAATIHDAVTIHNLQNLRGRTCGLTEQQIEDLVEYVLSL